MDITAVVDRFEGRQAVLLVGAEETAVIWPRAYLPAAAREGDVLTVRLAVDEAATAQARDVAAALLEKLRQRKKEEK